jgi:hypothetical protein
VFGTELGRLRERGLRLAEGASLAIDPAYRTAGVAILVRLLRMATLYAARIARLDELCFVLRPRHRDFYLTLLPFRLFTARRGYRRLDGADVIGLHLDLALVRALIRIERAGLSAGPSSHFLCASQAHREVIGRMRRDLPRSGLTPLEWACLFSDDSRPDGGGGQEACGAVLSTVELGALVGAVHSEPGGQA